MSMTIWNKVKDIENTHDHALMQGSILSLLYHFDLHYINDLINASLYLYSDANDNVT